jgi:NADH-quinone oxidoreductase subunit L
MKPSGPDRLPAFADSHVLHDMHDVPTWVRLSPFVMMAAGLLVAYQFYIRSPEMPKQLAERHSALYQFLLNKWYFDELYNFIFVRPAMWLGRFFGRRAMAP